MRLAGIQQFLKERHLPFNTGKRMTAPVLNLTIVGFTIIFGNFPNQSVAHRAMFASQVVVRSLATITKKRF